VSDIQKSTIQEENQGELELKEKATTPLKVEKQKQLPSISPPEL